jgi:hypothetical protein
VQTLHDILMSKGRTRASCGVADAKKLFISNV